MLFVVESVLLIAQTDNKGTPPHAKRTIVKEGVKMYELKVDSNSGVIIVDPNQKKVPMQNKSFHVACIERYNLPQTIGLF
jgi:hypothetical protein